jgi:toxoflavin biosynthesis protein ToxD
MPPKQRGNFRGMESASAPGSSPNKLKSPLMITIPAGEFYMGTSEDQIYQLFNGEDWAQEWFDKDLFVVEQPFHLLDLPAFEIGRFPVTNQEYYEFVWDSGYRAPRGWMGLHFPSGLDTHPVVMVSRKDALAYIEWLNKRLKTTFRLPNEAEWEKASRGDDGRIYPWGDEFDPWRCNTVESGKNATTPVGNYSPGGDSTYGVADMIGNVWEWTTNQLIPYPFDPLADPAQSSDSRIVVRGGAWYYSQKLARCACREGVMVDYVSTSLGFRLARSISVPG